MAKQTKAEMRDLEDFKEEIKAMLEHQNHRMDHLIWQVVGNEKLGIEGLKPALRRIEKDVHDHKKWREDFWTLDLKKLFTLDLIKKGVIICIAIGGGSFGIGKLLELIFK